MTSGSIDNKVLHACLADKVILLFVDFERALMPCGHGHAKDGMVLSTSDRILCLIRQSRAF